MRGGFPWHISPILSLIRVVEIRVRYQVLPRTLTKNDTEFSYVNQVLYDSSDSLPVLHPWLVGKPFYRSDCIRNVRVRHVRQPHEQTYGLSIRGSHLIFNLLKDACMYDVAATVLVEGAEEIPRILQVWPRVLPSLIPVPSLGSQLWPLR